MGTFALCVESTAREVNTLLGFHNVHPQVRNDVQRRLQRLIEGTYQYIGTFEPGCVESSTDICAVIVNELVDNTIHNVLPLVELSSEEKRTATLFQRIRDLEAELMESQKHSFHLDASLERLRKAHEFMLRCYFREVLVLRYQLQEAGAQISRRQESSSSILPHSQMSFVTPTRASKVHPKDNRRRRHSAVEPNEMPPAVEVNSSNADSSSDVAAQSTSVHMSILASCTMRPSTITPRRVSIPDAKEYTSSEEPSTNLKTTVLSSTSVSATSGASSGNMSPVNQKNTASRGTAVGRGVRDGKPSKEKTWTEGFESEFSPINLKDHKRSIGLIDLMTTSLELDSKQLASHESSESLRPVLNQFSPRRLVTQVESRRNKLQVKKDSRKSCGTQTRAIQTSGNSSTNAIFDYETYIQEIYNHQQEYERANKEEEKATKYEMQLRDKLRREEISGLRCLHRNLQQVHETTVASLTEKIQNDATYTKATTWRTALAMKPIKETLLDQLDVIRKGMKELRAQHQADILALRDAMQLVQARSDHLLKFIEVYADEVGRITTLISSDGDLTSGTPHRLSSVAQSATNTLSTATADDPCQSKSVFDFFITSRTPSPSLNGSQVEYPSTEHSHSHEAGFWAAHPTTLHAKRVFAALQNSVFKLRERTRSRQTRRGTRQSITDRLRGSLARVRDAEGHGCLSDTELDEDDLNLFSNLSHDDLLHALVQYRMRRVGQRARLHNRLRHLADNARRGRSVVDLLHVLAQAQQQERRVTRTTRIIDHILRLLGLEEATSEGLAAAEEEARKAFFLKNLALSPYLYDPPGTVTSADALLDGEVVYIPVPVRTEDAADLCTTLSTGRPGYVLFQDEVIPIASITYNSTGHPITHGRGRRRKGDTATETEGASEPHSTFLEGSDGGGRRMVPFHGTVLDYCRGVQMGRPLGDTHDPLFVFYDADAGSFLLVQETPDMLRHPLQTLSSQQAAHAPSLPMRSTPSLPFQRPRNVRLATILLSPPLPGEGTHAAEPPSLPPPPIPSTSATQVPKTVPIASTVLRPTPRAVLPIATVPHATRLLPPFGVPTFGTESLDRTARHVVLPSQTEEGRDMLRVESLTSRRPAPQKVLPVLDGQELTQTTALQRLKGERGRRFGAEEPPTLSGKRQRKVDWGPQPQGNPTQASTREKFLRMRLPRVHTPTPPASESEA